MVPSPEFDLVLGGVARFSGEASWAWRLVRRFARELPARCRVEARGRRVVVSDAAGGAPLVLVQADPEAYLTPAAAFRLLESASGHGADLVVPVSNEPWSEQARGAPAFAYQTPSLLERVAMQAALCESPPAPATDLDSPVYAVQRSVLAGLPPDLPLDEVPAAAARAGRRLLVDPGAYLHRYADMERQERSDLADRLPGNARSVLDVGCSRGATAARLRKRGVKRIVGIEPDAESASDAAAVCDRV